MKACKLQPDTACRPHGCGRYDCEHNEVTYEEAVKRYKEHYPNQARNMAVKEVHDLIQKSAFTHETRSQEET